MTETQNPGVRFAVHVLNRVFRSSDISRVAQSVSSLRNGSGGPWPVRSVSVGSLRLVERNPCQLGDATARHSRLPGTGQSLTCTELPAGELQALVQDTQLRSVVEVHDDRTG